RRSLPRETHHHVTTITGHAPEHWVNGAPENVDFAAEARVPCRDEIEAHQAPQVDMPVRMAGGAGTVAPRRAPRRGWPPPAAPPPSARAGAPARAALLKPHAPRPEVRRTEA